MSFLSPAVLGAEPVTSLYVTFVRTLSGFSLKWDALTFKLVSLPQKLLSVSQNFLYTSQLPVDIDCNIKYVYV